MPIRLPDPARSPDDYAALPCARCPGKNTNLCRPLAGQLQAELFELGLRQRWVRREYLFRAGDRAGPIFKVTAGSVAVSRSLPGGQRAVLRLLLPGDVCGYLSEDGRYAFDGEALTEVATCTFPREPFEAFEARNGAFAEAVRLELSAVLREVGRHVAAVGQLPAHARIANFLVEMQQAADARGLHGPALHLPMTRNDIGDYLGTRVETVSRALTALQRRGLITLRGETVTIVNLPGLAAVARRSIARRA